MRNTHHLARLGVMCLPLALLAACQQPSDPAATEAAPAPEPEQPMPVASAATEDTSTAETAGSGATGGWGFVAGGIYASGEACGFDQAELDAYKARARKKVEAMGSAASFEADFAKGVATGRADAAGGAPDARMCELTREAFARG